MECTLQRNATEGVPYISDASTVPMRYQNVCLEALGYTLPVEIVSSTEIERRLTPLYQRLRLPEGRLELMTGIRERRFWPPDTLPSEKSIESAEKAIQVSGVDRQFIGALVHGSVCRDFLEPATACRVHHHLGLSRDCVIYDLSNACLGILNGMVQVANMIELGQIRAGLVVGTEASRPLVETTIAALNRDESITRDAVKSSIASLTIGSGSVAVLLTDRELSRTGNRLLAATARANTDFHDLCQSGRDEAVAAGMAPLMNTDSEQLMHQGIAMGVETFGVFLDDVGWTVDQVDKVICHQVGSAHRKLMLESLTLEPASDFTTVETLGNTGSVALPITMALGVESGYLQKDDRVAMLGIGSGINSVMLAVDWQNSWLKTAGGQHAPHFRSRRLALDSRPSTLDS
jgi:3-oxoacyl-[acyl-carrier-protein] synthase-3